ncbi:MAG: Wzz/FepE/Etk N-terminal domain-containing protein [Acidobacteriota bacterium]
MVSETREIEKNTNTAYGQSAGQAGESGGFPLDIRTLLLGIWKRRNVVIGFIAVFLILAFLISSIKHQEVYEAETVMLYKPPPAPEEDDPYKPLSLTTQIEMIKMQSNLEEIRKRLELKATLKSIAAACEITLEKGTTLIILDVKWDSAKGAADLANIFREVFIESQLKLRREEAATQIHDLEARLKIIREKLREADAKLLQYTTANTLIDLSKQSQWALEQLNSVELLFEQAKIEQQSNELQLKNIERIIEDLKRRVAKEQSESASEMESVTVNNVRLQRLREAIDDDKLHRARMAEYTEKEVEFETAKRLRAQGLISDVDFAKIQAAFEKLKAIAVDTEQIKEWREQIKDLDKVVIPSKAGSASAPVLQSMLLKQFDLELQRSSLSERAEHLKAVRDKVKSQIDEMPKLERQYVAYSRDVTTLESEKKTLEDLLVKAHRVHDSESSDFVLVAEAKPPVAPVKSNRAILFIVIAVAGLVLGFVAAVGSELMDTTVKSAGDLKAKLSIPVIGVIPKLPEGERLFESKEIALVENLKMTTRKIRRQVNHHGARILLASASHGEGTTWVATNLAASLGRQGDRVLLIDSQIRMRNGIPSLRDWVKLTENDEQKGRILPADIETGIIESGRKIIAPLRKRLPEFIKPPLRFSRSVIKKGIAVISSPAAFFAGYLQIYHQRKERRRWANRQDIAGLIDKPSNGMKGLGAFLDEPAVSFDDAIFQTVLPNVDCLPQIGCEVIPEDLGTSKMRQLFINASEKYDVVIIDSPPILPYVDAEVLAQWADAIVLVVQGRMCTGATLKKAMSRIESAGAPVIGTILNGIDSIYLEKD